MECYYIGNGYYPIDLLEGFYLVKINDRYYASMFREELRSFFIYYNSFKYNNRLLLLTNGLSEEEYFNLELKNGINRPK